MAYEVTATRRRPKSFNELVGQDFVVATLKSSIENGSIAHAYLFSGPRGCGKTSAARILARSLNCDKGPTVNPCGKCPSCQEITLGSSMDVLEIDGASNTSVNDVRKIKDEVLFPPNSGHYKIYIIDEVHMLSNAAFNALLKTIEEPPPYIIFIFATTEIHKVPATIKSRCQQFQFRLIPIETIKLVLMNACQELGIKAEDDALFWIAKESTGSLRDAYTLFDQIASFSDGNLSAELIKQKLGLIGLDAINALAEACLLGETAHAFSIVDDILQNGIAIERFVVDLTEYYRSLLLIKSGITKDSILGFDPSRFARGPINSLSSIQIEYALSLLLNLYRDIRYSVSQRFDLECVISRLCWLRQWIDPIELRSAIENTKNSLFGSLSSQPSSTQKLNHQEKVTEGKYPDSSSNTPPDASVDLSTSFKQYIASRDTYQPVADNAAPNNIKHESILAASMELETSNSTLDLNELRIASIKQLQREHGILASGLDKSGIWSLDGETLVIPVSDTLTAELLRKDHGTLVSVFLSITGNRWYVDIVENNNAPPHLNDSPNSKEPSQAVETVTRLFRGTIVDDKGRKTL